MYDHTAVEKKWQEKWLSTKINGADIAGAGRPFYNLMMFPYPSAEGLHVGNMYAFTGSDIYGRFKRMQGYDVFEPIGLDGFGIHSENFALKIGRHPMDHAVITQKNFYDQLHKIGAMFDWERTLETYNPDYYRWTQWLFVQMFKHGLAYRGKASVNWCPADKTVLADEQVINGKCERCGNLVENRSLEQWFFRITAYAEKLLNNLPSLDWSEKVKIAQANWIGKKEGINITYPVVDEKNAEIGSVTCFTTRPETNFGATFVVLSPEHPLISRLKTVPKSGRGVCTGAFAINRLNKTKLPLYVADYVVSHVGTGAVVGVPAHDDRDLLFAKEFDIPVVRVITDDGIMENSDFLNGLDADTAAGRMTQYLEEKGWGKRTTIYHLRDWLISRQRYWGAPIPMIYCKKCASEGKSWFTTEEGKEYIEYLGGWPASNALRSNAGWYPVPDVDLPVKLPRIEDYKPGDDGVAPLAKHKEFYETVCPGCGGAAVRETDVSDTFLDSSWYFLRYPSTRCARSGQVPFDQTITKKWLPVHMYTGGAEHSVLHLLYSRFVTMALRDWDLLDFDEPFAKFYAHGLVIKDGAKMSKSRGNVVNPDEYIKLYGSDALRLYLMFMGPFDQGGDFRDASMEGVSRWVGRVWRLAQKQSHGSSATIHSALQKLIKRVGDDIEKRRYNTAIAAMMEFTNYVADEGGALERDDLKKFIRILAPFAPHLAEELWERAGGKFSVHTQPWPAYDPAKIIDETVTIAVQVNGKLRDTVVVKKELGSIQKDIETLAKNSEKVQKFLTGKPVRSVIFVPGRLINLVV